MSRLHKWTDKRFQYLITEYAVEQSQGIYNGTVVLKLFLLTHQHTPGDLKRAFIYTIHHVPDVLILLDFRVDA